MKKMKHLVIFLALLSSSSLACSITANDKADGGRCVDVGGYQLYTRIFGKTAPLVIFDSGSGDDSSVWDAVISQVAEFSRVLVYDRAGLGKSDAKPGSSPITSQESVEALKHILSKENIKPPYLLVGHSRGGLNMQLYAQKYPDEVAGVVLIDSVSRKQNFHDPAPPKTSKSYREAISFDQSREQVKNAQAFPPLPLIVLTATHHHESEQREQMWQQWQDGIANLSPKAMHIFAYGSGNYIQKQQPQLVINAIYTLVRLIGCK